MTDLIVVLIKDCKHCKKPIIYSHIMTDSPNIKKNMVEEGLTFQPKYDSNGLITAVISDHENGQILMIGHMNEEALKLTLSTGQVHFYSRSRQKLWKKGESSGHILHMTDMFTDCDQDALWIKARPDGPTCHTMRQSCFYRRVLSREHLEHDS